MLAYAHPYTNYKERDMTQLQAERTRRIQQFKEDNPEYVRRLSNMLVTREIEKHIEEEEGQMKILIIEINPEKSPASKACWNPPKYMTPSKHKEWLEGS